MDHNMVFSNIMPSKKGGGDKWMYFRCKPFLWPCWRVEAMHMILPNAARQGLHQMPLEAATRRLLTLYRPGGHQGNSKQNIDK